MEKKGKMTLKQIMFKLLMRKQNEDPEELLKIIKENYSYKEYQKCIDSMLANKYYAKKLNDFSKIKDVNDIFLESCYPVLSLLKEKYSLDCFHKDFTFLLAILKSNASLVAEFNELRNLYEKNYLSGKYSEALANLSDIKDKCGLSFWYIESQLLVLNKTNYHDYSDYYNFLKETTEEPIIHDYIRLLKRKNNFRSRQIDVQNFFNENFMSINVKEKKGLDKEKAKDDKEKAKDDKEKKELIRIIVDYIKFMCFEQTNKINDEMKRHLCIIGYHLPIIDLFLLCKRMIDYLIGYETLDTVIKPILEDFQDVFFIYDPKRGQKFHEIKETLCIDPASCINLCEKELNDYPERFEILDIYVKSLYITKQKIPSSNKLLDEIAGTFLKCYEKEDIIEYSVDCVDMCNRYLMALNSFSAYPELLNIVADRTVEYGESLEAFYKIKIYNRRYLCAEGCFYCEDSNVYLSRLKDLYATLYICDWNICLRKKLEKVGGIEYDSILKKIIQIDSNFENYTQNYEQGIGQLYYEEYMINKFQNALNNHNYIDAIHIYIEAYIKRKFFVLRMDVPLLNNSLPEYKCEPYLSEMDFFLYASINKLNKYYEEIESQTVIDSFASILIDKGITRPTDLVKNGEKPDERTLLFLDFVCNDILNQSPCDLYDDQMLTEQINILKILNKYKNEEQYKEQLSKKEQELDYLQIEDNLKDDSNLTTDKIIADWINIDIYNNDLNTNNILTSWFQLKNYSKQMILENEQLLSDFRDMFAKCKKNYVKQVNSQMGVTIRHGILDSEFVQLFKNNHLFFPECDEKEKNIILQNNKYLMDYPEEEKIKILANLQKSCLSFFKNIEEIKEKYIFFTHYEKYKDHIPMFITMEELKDYIRKINDISTLNKFIYEIKNILDNILSDKLKNMQIEVTSKLEEYSNIYYQNVYDNLLSKNNAEELECFKNELSETINSIGTWFRLSHNGQRLYYIYKYILKLREYYNNRNNEDVENDNITINCNAKDNEQLPLNTISWIDCILKNIVTNIQNHSGFSNLSEAQSVITIDITSEDTKKISIYSKNVISKNTTIDTEKIAEINQMIDFLKLNSTCDIDDGHGLGFRRIATNLLKYFENPYMNANTYVDNEDNIFNIIITFECRGGK